MDDNRSTFKQNTVSVILDWIDENIQNDIRAQDVTNISGYTHWHFQKIFSKITGHTLAEYIRIKRILCVSEMLAHTRYKITHISTDFGFPSQQSLARLFRKYFNCTPSEFRRATKANPGLYEVIEKKVLANGSFNLKSLD